ncbi:MAG: arylsulfatase [Planctomycetes bacterium]|nr:arylsulfatase [Planctomycetota bacterium]
MHNSTLFRRAPLALLLLATLGCRSATQPFEEPRIAARQPERKLPNIVVALFDDLGYGQPRPYAPSSEFRLPQLERLAADGMTFTDAHAAAAVCTPTRYGLLTGRHPCRIGQFGVLTTWSPPLIPKQRTTVASLLRGAGYHTACIGKWHLGLNWDHGRPGTQRSVPVGEHFTDGPNAVGFDYFYGFTHARNIATVLEQDRVVAHVDPVDNQPLMIAKAVDYIGQRAAGERPFLLYFAMCPPHTPVVPAADYVGRSGAVDLVGKDPKYGDWMMQGDDMLGQLLAALERAGIADDTLVIAASDNGAEHRAYPPLRGSKRSIYEGGHRVPFVARWPGRIAAGSTCDHTACLDDLIATCAEVIGTELPADAGEDSTSLLPALLGDGEARPRPDTVHQSMQGDLALRHGRWKLIFHRDGRRELFDLDADLGETSDLSLRHADVVANLTQRMQTLIDRGRSSPGPAVQNDFELTLPGSRGSSTRGAPGRGR